MGQRVGVFVDPVSDVFGVVGCRVHGLDGHAEFAQGVLVAFEHSLERFGVCVGCVAGDALLYVTAG